MNKEDFRRLANLYAQRYGAFHMQPETADMWYAKLKSLPLDHVKEAFYQLLGQEMERPFGWKKVFVVVDAMYPPESEVVALERQYKSDPRYSKDPEKRKEVNAIMRSLMDEYKTRKAAGETFDWMPEFAHHFVEIWGEEEASNIIAKNVSKDPTDQDKRLQLLVNDNIRHRHGN